MRTRSQKRVRDDDQFYCLDAKRKPIPVVPNTQLNKEDHAELSQVIFIEIMFCTDFLPSSLSSHLNKFCSVGVLAKPHYREHHSEGG